MIADYISNDDAKKKKNVQQQQKQSPGAHTHAEKNCPTYLKNKTERQTLTSYTFHFTGETRPITHHIDCNSKNVIYVIQCNTKMKPKDSKTVSTNTADQLTTHLISPDLPQPQNILLLMITLLTLIPLELIKSNRDSAQKARGAYLIERGKAIGINKKG